MNHISAKAWLGTGVIVAITGRSCRPWRAQVIACGARFYAGEWIDAGHVMVQPLERGQGWSTRPVIVSLAICEPQRQLGVIAS